MGWWKGGGDALCRRGHCRRPELIKKVKYGGTTGPISWDKLAGGREGKFAFDAICSCNVKAIGGHLIHNKSSNGMYSIR